MKLQFPTKEIPCLQNMLSQVQSLEQTQELRIPEGMPGAERILSAWGQILLRSKEWGGDSIHVAGGVLVWVLYEPEDGSAPRCLESWIPFQMRWDLPDGSPEGKIRVAPLLRYVDARSVSAGKILLRAGIALMAQCWGPYSAQLSQPENAEHDVELLRSSWPIRLPQEAGEKSFEMEEELTLPASAPLPEKLVYYRMEPTVVDRKVLGNKLVFRGNGNLHLLYLSEDGHLHNWDFEVPFSQYAELENNLSSDAQGDVIMALTRLELEPDGDGKLQLKAGLTGQYLVDDRQMVETVEDVYSPYREMEIQREVLELPAILDSRRENIYGEQTIPAAGDIIADASFLPDFPRQQREGEGITLEQPGMAQLLYYDQEGRIQSASHKWEGNLSLPADVSTRVSAMPLPVQPQVIPGTDSMTLRAEVPVQILSMAGQGLPMVRSVDMGERKEPDPGRPSLVLRRAGNDRLWDLARNNGSTMAAIREANGLTGEPEPNRMLLIPVM